MKTPASTAWVSGLILGLGWWSFSFAQNDVNHLDKSVPDLAPPVSSQVKPTVPSSSPVREAMDFPPSRLSDQDAPIIKRQPPKLRLSPWTTEVVKLAESGIETDVILAFIENSGTFNLGADQIVYLNDLGLSGEIVNAMLRHDRELISGAKPLTITSEPEWEFSFDSVSAGGNRVSAKPSPEPSIAPVRRAEVVDPESRSVKEASPDDNRLVATTAAATFETILPNEVATGSRSTFNWREQPADTKKSPYPVREPYPVEITAPIVFINGDGRIANTLVVLGFPRSAR